MSSINLFVIDGNVTRDIELRFTSRGTPTCTYAVASNYSFGEGGNKREGVDFVPVTTYGRQAEADAKYLKKGSPVTVTGRIRSWYNKDTKTGGFNFEAETVKYQGRRSGGGAAEGQGTDRAASAPGNVGDGDEWLRDYNQHSGHGAGGPNAR
jgi:single-strand DNA-binding protein